MVTCHAKFRWTTALNSPSGKIDGLVGGRVTATGTVLSRGCLGTFRESYSAGCRGGPLLKSEKWRTRRAAFLLTALSEYLPVVFFCVITVSISSR